MIFAYCVSVVLALLLGAFLPKGKLKPLRKKERAVEIQEIRNFLNYDGDEQE